MKRPGTRINFFFFFFSPNLYQEPYATSFAAHARTRCEDFCGCSAGEMASEIPEMTDAFGLLLNTFMSVGILLQYFRRKLLQLE